jgi:hypothetical protein
MCEKPHTETISVIVLYSLRHINGCSFHSGEPGSSVSIVSDYGLDVRTIEVRSRAEAKGFFL